jgi:hypothetical protein
MLREWAGEAAQAWDTKRSRDALIDCRGSPKILLNIHDREKADLVQNL